MPSKLSPTSHDVRKCRTVVTSIRPPQVIADAIVLLSRERNVSRCRVIRDLLDGYLDAETTQSSHQNVRLIYASLRCKVAEKTIPFACDERRLRTYRLAAKMLRTRSVAGLLTLAAIDSLGLLCRRTNQIAATVACGLFTSGILDVVEPVTAFAA